MIDFQIVGLPLKTFSHLFSLSDAELREHDARRFIADTKPGSPCRVSLEEAEVGERVILINYAHHDVASPYRASGPIFIRETAVEATLGKSEIPVVLNNRRLSVRGYDSDAMMIGADVTSGDAVVECIGRLFEDDAVVYLHIHNASPGCFSCQIERV